MWYLPLLLVIDIETRDQRKRAGSDCPGTEKMVNNYRIGQVLEDLWVKYSYSSNSSKASLYLPLTMRQWMSSVRMASRLRALTTKYCIHEDTYIVRMLQHKRA